MSPPIKLRCGISKGRDKGPCSRELVARAAVVGPTGPLVIAACPNRHGYLMVPQAELDAAVDAGRTVLELTRRAPIRVQRARDGSITWKFPQSFGSR